MGAPIGYTLDVPISTLTHTEFMLAGPPEQLGPARSLKVRFGGFDLQEDWTTSSGEGVRVVERMAPYAVLIGGEPSFDDVLAAVGDRSRWRETTVRDGRVNALQARIGRIATAARARRCARGPWRAQRWRCDYSLSTMSPGARSGSRRGPDASSRPPRPAPTPPPRPRPSRRRLRGGWGGAGGCCFSHSLL